MVASVADFLQDYVRVVDQATMQLVPYSPWTVTENLQATALSYIDDTPRDRFGATRWLTVLASRQTGKSLVFELGMLPKTATNPGWDHACMADTDDRAAYLHGRVHSAWEHLPPSVKFPIMRTTESKQMTFPEKTGGKMRIMSAREGYAAIGQSIASFHGSELPFWLDADSVLSYLFPAMLNRQDCLMMLESTPAPIDAPSAVWWRDHCAEAKRGIGRHLYAFFPMWDGKLNRRPWNPKDKMDLEELRLMEKWGPHGMTADNLAFRRYTLETDQKLRRMPELFWVFYPTDDISCWGKTGAGFVREAVLQQHRDRVLVPWTPDDTGYQEYEEPDPAATYVVGGDGSGFAVRDHAAAHVFKICEDAWVQVASFSSPVANPLEFAVMLDRVGRRYNNATIVVESNGVGAGPLTALLQLNYPALWYQAYQKPGKTTTGKSLDEMTGWMIDALMDKLIIRDADLLEQLATYKNDKRVEDGVVAEQLRGGIGRRRRERHHWDKVSALLMAVVGAREARPKTRHNGAPPTKPVATGEMSVRSVKEHFRQQALRAKNKRTSGLRIPRRLGRK